MTIENNFFDCCRSGYFAIRLADHPGTSWNDVTIRNNSSNKAINLDGGVPYSNVKVTGNIAPELSLYTGATGGESAVPSGVTVDYNVWYAGSRRGPHDQVAPAGFIDPGALDFHLSAGAAAIGAGDPAGSPARDIDGDSRSDAAPDVGADEFRTAPSPPDTTGSPVRRWRRRFSGLSRASRWAGTPRVAPASPDEDHWSAAASNSSIVGLAGAQPAKSTMNRLAGLGAGTDAGPGGFGPTVLA